MGCNNSTDDQNDTSFDYLFKLVMVGQLGVGKSSLVLRYIDDYFLDEDVGTIGSDFKVKFLDIDSKRVKLQIWDTAGTEKFRQMTSSYFGGANAVIVVFDVTNEESFTSIDQWVEESRRFSQQSSPLQYLFIGNKKDMEKERKVDKEKARELAESYESLYIETSAKSGTKVNEAFYMIAEQLKKFDDGTELRL